MLELPENAQRSALDIFESLRMYDSLKSKTVDDEEVRRIKMSLCDSIESFKKNHPELVDTLYKGFSKCAKKTKKIINIKNRLNDNLISLRMLTSSYLIAIPFHDRCLPSKPILYIHNETIKGNVPSNIDEMDQDYKENMKVLAKDIRIKFEENPTLVESVIDLYKRDLCWSAEESEERAYSLQRIATLIEQDLEELNKNL